MLLQAAADLKTKIDSKTLAPAMLNTLEVLQKLNVRLLEETVAQYKKLVNSGLKEGTALLESLVAKNLLD